MLLHRIGSVDPVPPQRPHRRSLRSPELRRRPEPEYHQKGIGAAGDLTICGQQPLRRPKQVEQASRRRNCAAPDSRPPAAKG